MALFVWQWEKRIVGSSQLTAPVSSYFLKPCSLRHFILSTPRSGLLQSTSGNPAPVHPAVLGCAVAANSAHWLRPASMRIMQLNISSNPRQTNKPQTNQTKPNDMTTNIQQCAIAYSTHEKTFCVTSPEIAQAMLFMGNAYGFNRVSIFPQSSVVHMRDVMEKNEFKSID